MAFFLIGRDSANGSVILLSSSAFASREEALGALSELALTGGLTDGAEVLVGDTDRMLPVLMLTAPVPAPAAEAVVPVEMSAPAYEPAPAEEPVVAMAEEVALQVVPDVAVDAAFAEAVMSDIDLDLAEPDLAEPLGAVEEPDEAFAETVSAEAAYIEPAPAADAETDPAPAEDTYAFLADEAVPVAVEDEPASLPSFEPYESAVAEPVAEVTENAGEVLSEATLYEATEQMAEDADVEAAGTEAVEPAEDAPAWPWLADLGSPGDELAAEASVEEPAVASADVAVAPVFEPSPIEEPAVDATSLLPASDDVYVPRPVIMGDYAEPADTWNDEIREPQGVADLTVVPFAPEPPVAADSDAPEPPETDYGMPLHIVEEPMTDVALPEAEFGEAIEAAVTDTTDLAASLAALGVSGPALETGAAAGSPALAFVTDVADETLPAEESAVPVETAEPVAYGVPTAVGEPDGEPDGEPLEEPRGYEPAEHKLADNTCDDCVYVTTCPKHHQSTPAECGSFQWKSL